MIIITSISNSSSRSRSSILLVFWYLVFNILFWDLFACCLWPGGQLHSSTLLVFIYISGVYREIQWATFCWKVHFLRDLKQNSSSIRSLLLPNVGMYKNHHALHSRAIQTMRGHRGCQGLPGCGKKSRPGSARRTVKLTTSLLGTQWLAWTAVVIHHTGHPPCETQNLAIGNRLWLNGLTGR